MSSAGRRGVAVAMSTDRLLRCLLNFFSSLRSATSLIFAKRSMDSSVEPSNDAAGEPGGGGEADTKCRYLRERAKPAKPAQAKS